MQKRGITGIWGGRFLDRVAKNDLPIKMTFGRCPERSEEAGCVIFRRRVV